MTLTHVAATAVILATYITCGCTAAAVISLRWPQTEHPLLALLFTGTALPVWAASTFATETELAVGMVVGAVVVVVGVVMRAWTKGSRR